jgi:site-specific recombinase XerD
MFQFAITRGYLKTAPLPKVLPKCQSSFIPHIYSIEELRRLLDAIPSYHRFPARLEPHTLRAILLLLYGTGLRRGEALRLSVADVDLTNSILTIRDTKFYKSRLVPISSALTKVLREYSDCRTDTNSGAKTESPFFVGRHGKPIHEWTMQGAFERLREYAGVRRSDGGWPRLHDLRHTFAVHRLTDWYRQGADVQRLVYHLSVYLGHARLAHTQIYLTMTPDLLRQAGDLFERYTRREDNDA